LESIDKLLKKKPYLKKYLESTKNGEGMNLDELFEEFDHFEE